jgi:hypothetical protein
MQLPPRPAPLWKASTSRLPAGPRLDEVEPKPGEYVLAGVAGHDGLS